MIKKKVGKHCCKPLLRNMSLDDIMYGVHNSPSCPVKLVKYVDFPLKGCQDLKWNFLLFSLFCFSHSAYFGNLSRPFGKVENMLRWLSVIVEGKRTCDVVNDFLPTEDAIEACVCVTFSNVNVGLFFSSSPCFLFSFNGILSSTKKKKMCLLAWQHCRHFVRRDFYCIFFFFLKLFFFNIIN